MYALYAICTAIIQGSKNTIELQASYGVFTSSHAAEESSLEAFTGEDTTWADVSACEIDVETIVCVLSEHGFKVYDKDNNLIVCE
jgi:hypothetical protein